MQLQDLVRLNHIMIDGVPLSHNDIDQMDDDEPDSRYFRCYSKTIKYDGGQSKHVEIRFTGVAYPRDTHIWTCRDPADSLDITLTGPKEFVHADSNT